tara:strand:+ start:121 stop:390 length:270 start_codon:yes stop_codon:yes gene_type:complete
MTEPYLIIGGCVLQEPNYFLYIIGTANTTKTFIKGDAGVGRTQKGPGICDARWGTMYIVTAKYILETTNSLYPHPETIKHNILKYYGVI